MSTPLRILYLEDDRIFVELVSGLLAMEGIPGHVVPVATRADFLAALERDADRFADRPMTWPLMIGAWKRKGLA